jgi:hypothetical protein
MEEGQNIMNIFRMTMKQNSAIGDFDARNRSKGKNLYAE